MADIGITTGGDTLSHVLGLGTNTGGAFTPDAIAAATEKVAAALRQISKEDFDAAGSDGFNDDDFLPDWSAFTAAFLGWKGAHSTWISNAWNETRDELVSYVNQYNALRARWLAIYPTSTAPDFTIQDAPKNTLDDWGKELGAALKHIGIGLAVVVAVPLLGYLAWKVVSA
jgi:hypothetical protein